MSHNQCLRYRSELKKPKYLEDFIMSAEDLVGVADNPEAYEEVLESKQSDEWRKVMAIEITSLKENQTWKLTSLPEGAKALPCKWVFHMKFNSEGSIDRRKARCRA